MQKRPFDFVVFSLKITKNLKCENLKIHYDRTKLIFTNKTGISLQGTNQNPTPQIYCSLTQNFQSSLSNYLNPSKLPTYNATQPIYAKPLNYTIRGGENPTQPAFIRGQSLADIDQLSEQRRSPTDTKRDTKGQGIGARILHTSRVGELKQ